MSSDDLQAELAAAKADRSTGRRNRLREFRQKLRRLRFLDPACGCGNFLVLAYREVRRLENEALIASLTQRGTLQRGSRVSGSPRLAPAGHRFDALKAVIGA